MAKKIDGYIKLQIKAGQANPAPPIGPALGQRGVNIMEFCKQFNATTQDRMGLILPVVITVFTDKSFTFIVKSPPAPVLLKMAAGIKSGAADPLRERVGSVTWDQCREIAERKMEDLNAHDLEQGAAMIAGTARSMGIKVEGRPNNFGVPVSAGGEATLKRPSPSETGRPHSLNSGSPYRPQAPGVCTAQIRTLMPKHGKRFRQSRDRVTKATADGPLDLEGAVALLKSTDTAKFDESVDIDIRLGVDPRHADQMVRGTAALPHGTGKEVRVLVLTNEGKQAEAREAGADHVGLDDYVEKIQKEGWVDFDVVIASPDVMAKVGRLGRVLGPRGLMPNPKSGTVTPNVGEAVQAVKAGKIDFRVDKFGNLHTAIGKISFSEEQLRENTVAFLREVLRLRPASSKGTYVRSLTLSTTMGPGIPLDRNVVLGALR